MKNRIAKILLITLITLLLVGCNRKLYTYSSESGEGVISEYTGSEASLVVPNSIDGKGVSIIGYNTFAYNIMIYNVLVSNGIEEIRGCAFWYCTSLNSIYIPSTVTKIEEYAFYHCTDLKYVFYEANEVDVNISIGDNNDFFTSAEKTYGVSQDEYKALINLK